MTPIELAPLPFRYVEQNLHIGVVESPLCSTDERDGIGRVVAHLSQRAGIPASSGAAARLDAEVMMSEIDLERALNDPADLFESPDAVVHHPTLTREQKIQILNNWQLDASRLEGSEGEGMIGEDPPMLRRVRLALAALMEQP